MELHHIIDPLLFTVSTDMKKTFIQTSCDLFDLSYCSFWAVFLKDIGV